MRALVVDDIAENRDVLGHMLEGIGVDVTAPPTAWRRWERLGRRRRKSS